jgi:hypothetical protein
MRGLVVADHYLRIGGEQVTIEDVPDAGALRNRVEPWLSAILQSEHLSLLVGNGFTTALALAAGVTPPSLAVSPFAGAELGDHRHAVERAALASATRIGRESPNIEDRIRSALQLIGGLQVLEDALAEPWHSAMDAALLDLVRAVLRCEREIDGAIRSGGPEGIVTHRLLVSFLLTFASRTASRERLNLFTTNYDRLVEYGCDLAGLRPLDRFVGALEPVFRASRLDVDLHYNPPGIRGEPRYLEGVLRLGKIHGSLDWRFMADELRRVSLPFGAPENHPSVPESPTQGLMVYPNPAKDVETLQYPYAELFRDLSAALCRPNSALVTYGYGYGDDHINRVIADMLSIPSTHLVVLAWDWCEGRLQTFMDRLGRDAQISLLVGPHFGDLETLVTQYLPKPAIDTISWRQAELVRRRQHTDEGGHPPATGDAAS